MLWAILANYDRVGGYKMNIVKLDVFFPEGSSFLFFFFCGYVEIKDILFLNPKSSTLTQAVPSFIYVTRDTLTLVQEFNPFLSIPFSISF